MDVLVVESPAKAKTIGKYLGPGYTVLASYGHVRDLPPKDGSVRPDEDFAMDWEVDPPSKKRLDAIAKAITNGGKLYLATDPDREGAAGSGEAEGEAGVSRARGSGRADALFASAKKQPLKARLTHLDGRKLDKFDLNSAERAEGAKPEIGRRAFSVLSIDRRQVRRNPPPPFITSTLQQEASRKLGVGAATAMRIAQRLYEGVDIGGETVGLITYMRTDGVQLAPEAIGPTRRLI